MTGRCNLIQYGGTVKYEFLTGIGKLADRHDDASFHFSQTNPLFSIPEDVYELMPEAVAREHACLPLGRRGNTLHVAHHDFDDINLQDKLRFILNRDIVFHVWPQKNILELIDRFYGSVEGESCDSILQEFTDTSIDFTETIDDSYVDHSARRKTKVRATATELSDQSLHDSSHAFKSSPSRQITNRLGNHLTNSGAGMFFYTIEEGRKALAYRLGGRIDVIEGPARCWQGMTRFHEMRHQVAHPGEFLIIRFRDGTQQHLEGPAQIWFDPRIHEEISVQEGLSLAAKEAVVVYGKSETGETQRRVRFGPGLFVPQPGEWLHKFSWHASEGGSCGVEKTPNALNFQKMWLMPDQMYHDVRDVRTADDAVLVIRLMIFFELVDIEKMLDTTHDPIGDFINAATSDVVEFTGRFTFEEFKKQTEHLNQLSTYSQLIHRAEQCGYQINNVVYRGYGAPESLQRMHDEAIAARTSLQLEKDTEKQTQELEDYRLGCQVERSERRRAEQTTEIEHDLMLQDKKKLAEIEVLRRREEVQRDQRRLNAEMRNELDQQREQNNREHLAELKSLGVELTEYLTQGRADQVIELRGGSKQQPHLHLNQSVNQSRKISNSSGSDS